MQVKLNKTSLLLLLWSTIVTTQPLNETDHELEGEYFEGDMILTEEQREWLMTPTLWSRNGILAPIFRWPNGRLLFRISSAFSDDDAELIMEAMADIESGSCIRFEYALGNANAYVNIVRPERGCTSYVGFKNRVQDLKLSKRCMSIGHIQHELLHALGFFHQQSDSKRDNYVKINYQNIKRGYEKNFKKYGVDEVDDFGVGYDYASVMHYGPYYFSRNNKPTIVPLEPGAKIGLRSGLTDKDFEKLNRMYDC